MEDLLRRLQPLWGVWSLDRPLGAGAFSQVWQVRRTDGAGVRYAALKAVRISFSDAALHAARLEGLTYDGAKAYGRALLAETLDEIETARTLSDCGHAVRFYQHQVAELSDGGESGWLVLILMEKLLPLKSFFLEREIALKDVARLGIHIATALEFCEKRGVVHRDVKPDNLFYSPEEGLYKLGDFGIARRLPELTGQLVRNGTLTHMPPEVYRGAPYAPSSDVYALGVILYRLLNDNRAPFLPPFPEPFAPKDRERALAKRLSGARIEEPSVIRYASRPERGANGLGAAFKESERRAAVALGKIAQKAIAANPERRFQSARELRQAIEDALA